MQSRRATVNKMSNRASKALPKPRAGAAPPGSSERPLPRVVTTGGGAAVIRPEYQDFARKLREAMAAQQLSASDVARAIWGSVPDPRGYEVARNRDRIGAYLAGTGYPSKETLPKLCAAVGLSPDELPPPTRSTAAREPAGPADLTFSLLPDHPEICSLYIRKLLPISVGLQILELVNKATVDEPK